jgi:putative transposase
MHTIHSKINQRRSIRLKGYNYTRPGYYFITICCHARAHLFGNIIGANQHSPIDTPHMVLNCAGKITQTAWLDIPKHFSNVALHEYCIMPNHIHGIIEIKSNDSGARKFTIRTL